MTDFINKTKTNYCILLYACKYNLFLEESLIISSLWPQGYEFLNRKVLIQGFSIKYSGCLIWINTEKICKSIDMTLTCNSGLQKDCRLLKMGHLTEDILSLQRHLHYSQVSHPNFYFYFLQAIFSQWNTLCRYMNHVPQEGKLNWIKRQVGMLIEIGGSQSGHEMAYWLVLQ